MTTDGASGPTLLLVGMPQSGKTTYLAALWHAVRSPERKTELTLERLPEDLDFFNSVVDRWIVCHEAEHTSRAAVSDPVLVLRSSSGQIAEVMLPDYSGEFIQDAWTNRSWPANMDRFVRSARALIVLVHPGFIQERVTIEEANRNADALQAEPPSVGREPAPFERSQVPSQTQLIEFIQFARSRASAKPMPVAVLVSAWDLAAEEEVSPDRWLDQHMPMLYQFLASNGDSLPCAIYGLSAQGGAWPDKRNALLDQDPHERAYVIDMAGDQHADVTMPIAWALAAH